MTSPILQKFGIDNFKGEIYNIIAYIIPFFNPISSHWRSGYFSFFKEEKEWLLKKKF